MDIYTLNSGFLADDVVDDYETVIWTERYSEAGDLVLNVPNTRTNRLKLREGTFISTPGTDEVMRILTARTEDGLLKCTGNSLTLFLRERMVRNQLLNNRLFWPLTGSPGEIMRWVVYQMCIQRVDAMSGSTVIYPGSHDNISNFVVDDVLSGPDVSVDIEYTDVYDQIQKVAATYDLGFRVYLKEATPAGYTLAFRVLQGADRTSTQTENDIVIFSPDTDTLMEPTEVRSIADHKNVAYAFAPNVKSATPYIGIAYSAGGQAARDFDRRVLLVNADEISDEDMAVAGFNLQATLNQKARDALANHIYINLVDGKVVPQSMYKPGVDYFLGDVVELSTAVGNSSKARVIEYIRTDDDSGYKEYPTLSVI